jgi:hypothetical protein
MDFGKRRLEQPPRRLSETQPDESLDVMPRATRNANAGGVSGALIGVVAGVVAILAGAGGALLHSSLSKDAEAGSPGPVLSVRAGSHARIAQVCMPAAGKGLRKVGLTDEEFRYQSAVVSASYFNCALVMERERFCAADEKTTLIKELQAYFGAVANKQYMYDKYVDDRSAQAMVKMASAVADKDGGISARPQRPEPDASLVENVRMLVREGLLAPGDFGWSVPAEIAPYINGIKTEKSSC